MYTKYDECNNLISLFYKRRNTALDRTTGVVPFLAEGNLAQTALRKL